MAGEAGQRDGEKACVGVDGGGSLPLEPSGVSSIAYFDLRIVSHGLVLCAVTLPIDPVWEMLQSKRVLGEASHEVAQEKARARDSSRYRRCGVVSKAWRDLNIRLKQAPLIQDSSRGKKEVETK